MSQEQTENQTTITNESELHQNPMLSMVVEKDSEMKDYLVEYVGEKLDEENVTVQMITEVLATEFPEFLISVAEENFLLGYQKGLQDADQLSQRETSTTEE